MLITFLQPRASASWLSRGFWQLQLASTHQTLGPRKPAMYDGLAFDI